MPKNKRLSPRRDGEERAVKKRRLGEEGRKMDSGGDRRRPSSGGKGEKRRVDKKRTGVTSSRSTQPAARERSDSESIASSSSSSSSRSRSKSRSRSRSRSRSSSRSMSLSSSSSDGSEESRRGKAAKSKSRGPSRRDRRGKGRGRGGVLRMDLEDHDMDEDENEGWQEDSEVNVFDEEEEDDGDTRIREKEGGGRGPLPSAAQAQVSKQMAGKLGTEGEDNVEEGRKEKHKEKFIDFVREEEELVPSGTENVGNTRVEDEEEDDVVEATQYDDDDENLNAEVTPVKPTVADGIAPGAGKGALTPSGAQKTSATGASFTKHTSHTQRGRGRGRGGPAGVRRQLVPDPDVNDEEAETPASVVQHNDNSDDEIEPVDQDNDEVGVDNFEFSTGNVELCDLKRQVEEDLDREKGNGYSNSLNAPPSICADTSTSSRRRGFLSTPSNGSVKTRSISENWKIVLSSIRHMIPDFFSSPEALLKGQSKAKKGASIYLPLDLSEFNNSDVREVYQLHFEPKMKSDMSSTNFSQFKTAIGQFARLAIASKQHRNVVTLCKKGELFTALSNIDLLTTLLDHFRLRSASATVNTKCNHLRTFLKAAILHFERRDMRASAAQSSQCLAFIMSSSNAAKRASRVEASRRRSHQAREAEGTLVTENDFLRYISVSREMLSGIGETYASGVRERMRDGFSRDHAEVYSASVFKWHTGLIEKWCINFIAALIFNTSGQRPQAHAQLAAPKGHDLIDFVRVSRRMQVFQLDTRTEKCVRSLNMPGVYGPDWLAPYISLHCAIVRPIIVAGAAQKIWRKAVDEDLVKDSCVGRAALFFGTQAARRQAVDYPKAVSTALERQKNEDAHLTERQKEDRTIARYIVLGPAMVEKNKKAAWWKANIKNAKKSESIKDSMYLVQKCRLLIENSSLLVHTKLGTRLTPSQITSLLQKYVSTQDPERQKLTMMNVRASFATVAIRRYRRKERWQDRTEIQFLEFLARTMNTSVESIRSTYARIDPSEYLEDARAMVGALTDVLEQDQLRDPDRLVASTDGDSSTMKQDIGSAAMIVAGDTFQMRAAGVRNGGTADGGDDIQPGEEGGASDDVNEDIAEIVRMLA